MVLVHRHATEAPLPEVAGPFQSGMDVPRIAPMQRRERPPQSVGVGGFEDQVNMIGHRHPRPHRDLRGAAMLAQQVAIMAIILVLEERPLATIAALGDVVWQSGDDDTGKAGHATSCPSQAILAKLSRQG